MICATRGYPSSNGGFCVGDSGGPLIAEGLTARTDRVVGLTSWGPGNCNSDSYPYVFTDVGAVDGWIRATMREMLAA